LKEGYRGSQPRQSGRPARHRARWVHRGSPRSSAHLAQEPAGLRQVQGRGSWLRLRLLRQLRKTQPTPKQCRRFLTRSRIR